MKTNCKRVNGPTTPVELVCDIDFVLHLQHFRPWPTDGPLPHVTSCQKPDQSAHRTASGCKRQPGAGLDSYRCQRGTGIPAVCLLPDQMLPFQLRQIPVSRRAHSRRPTVQELWNCGLKQSVCWLTRHECMRMYF